MKSMLRRPCVGTCYLGYRVVPGKMHGNSGLEGFWLPHAGPQAKKGQRGPKNTKGTLSKGLFRKKQHAAQHAEKKHLAMPNTCGIDTMTMRIFSDIQYTLQYIHYIHHIFIARYNNGVHVSDLYMCIHDIEVAETCWSIWSKRSAVSFYRLLS